MIKKIYNLITKTKPSDKNGFVLKGNVKNNHIDLKDQASFMNDNSVSFWRESSGNKVSIEENFKANNLKIVFKGHNNHVIIGKDVSFTGHILIVGNDRKVIIGDNTTVKGAYILCRGRDVTIGENCLFSREIEIRSTDVHKIYDLDTKKHLNKPEDIIIGDHVWIGARAFLSKGAVIPNNSVVGAMSFVNKSFTKENVVIAGSPAKIIKENIMWER